MKRKRQEAEFLKSLSLERKIFVGIKQRTSEYFTLLSHNRHADFNQVQKWRCLNQEDFNFMKPRVFLKENAATVQ